MRAVEHKSGISPASRYLILSACFIVIIAGIRTAEPIIVPFLLSAFIAVICTSPLFWLKKKGVPASIAVLIVLLGIGFIGLIMMALVGTSLNDFSNELPIYQTRLRIFFFKSFRFLQSDIRVVCYRSITHLILVLTISRI